MNVFWAWKRVKDTVSFRDAGRGGSLALLLVMIFAQGAFVLHAANQDYEFTTWAGVRPLVNPDGQGTNAQFRGPSGLAADNFGSLYVADSGRNSIRRISPAGEVTTISTAFSNPRGVALDLETGAIFVADTGSHTIKKLTPPTWEVEIVAGSEGQPGSTDEIGANARFNRPWGIAVRRGELYVADSGNHAIRRITLATRSVTTLAGTPGMRGLSDGVGSGALFDDPKGIAVWADENQSVYLFVADAGNDAIRKITVSERRVITFAGDGTQGSFDTANGIKARFSSPHGVSVDRGGNVYVADSINSTIRRIRPDGVVTTIAGEAGFYRLGDVDGTGSEARFYHPVAVTVDYNDVIYVADFENDKIRRVWIPFPGSYSVQTLAGSPPYGSANGVRNQARFRSPSGVAVTADGTAYVADEQNSTIRRINSIGVVELLAGRPGLPGRSDGPGLSAGFTGPSGIAVDSSGYIYVSESSAGRIRLVLPNAFVTTISERGILPSDVALDQTGSLYVTQIYNQSVVRISPNGLVSQFAGGNGRGTNDGPVAVAQFDTPRGVAVDRLGNVFVADRDNHTIRKITAAGFVSTLAGQPGVPGSSDGRGPEARFRQPERLTVDRFGYIYVADSGNHTIRKITPAGVVTTIGGWPGNFGNVNGRGAAARFHRPQGIAVDNSGHLYIADTDNHAIRKGILQVPLPVNRPPTAVPLIQTTNYVEGTAVVGLPPITVSDPDPDEVITATLTLDLPATGRLTTSGNALYNPTNGVWAITGTLDQVNDALARVVFLPEAENELDATIAISIRDAANEGPNGTFTLDVAPVNDPPRMDSLPALLSLLEDAAAQTLNLTGLAPGPTNELAQTLTLTATAVTNANLIVDLSVSYTNPPNALLRFRPAPDAHGTATIRLVVQDSGGTLDGGANAITNFLTVAILPVNDPPTLLRIGSPLTIAEDSPLQSIPLTAISAGPADERATQTLTVLATSDNPEVLPNPIVAYSSPADTGRLDLVPRPNAHGAATVTVVVRDSGGTSHGGIDAVTNSVTVTVLPVNDAPTLAPISFPTALLEDAAEQTVNLIGISSGATNEVQTLLVSAFSSATNVVPHPLVDYTSPNTNAFLRFTPLPNANGRVTVAVVVRDNGDTDNGGINAVTNTFTFDVIPVNDPPTLALATSALTLTEDAGPQTIALTNITAGPPNETQTLSITATSSVPALIPNPAVNYTSPATNGALTFSPAPNAHGTALLFVVAKDNGGTADGGVDVTTNQLTVTITPVNDAPTLNTGPFALASTDEDTPTPATPISTLLTALNHTDPDRDALSGIAIVGSTGNGNWQFATDGTNWTNLGSVATNSALLLSGNTSIRYLPDGRNGETASLRFRAWDQTDGRLPSTGAARHTADTSIHGGANAFSVTVAEVTLQVRAVNDLPVVSGTVAGQTLTDKMTVAPFASVVFADVDLPPQTNTVTVALDDPAKGAFTPASLNAAGFRPGISPGAYQFVGLLPEAQSATRQLVFAPFENRIEPGRSETNTLTISLSDGAGPAVLDRVTTLIVTSVNDAPTISGARSDQRISEKQTVAPFSALTIGDADSAQLQAVLVQLDVAAKGSFTAGSLDDSGFSAVDPAGTYRFSGTASQAQAALRNLLFKPAEDRAPIGSSETTRFRVVVTDTAGASATNEQTSVISFAVNDAPTLAPIPDPAPIFEDAREQTIALSGITTGGDQNQTLRITAMSSDPLLIPTPAIDYTPSESTARLRFSPAPDAFGSATISVTVQDDGGRENGGIDSVTRSFVVTVLPVNDAPVLTLPRELTLPEDTLPRAVLVSGISAGPKEFQQLTLTATSNNTGLIPDPAVTYASPGTNATLTLNVLPSASGAAVITVILSDDGGTDRGGVNSVTHHMLVTVLSVNDPPTLDPLPDITIREDAPPQTIELRGISAGPGNENQMLTIVARSSDPALLPDPVVSHSTLSPTATLTFAPAPNAFGRARVSIVLTDEEGVADGGINATTNAFFITVHGINDPPTLNPIADVLLPEDAPTHTIQLSGISAGLGNETNVVTITAISDNRSLIPDPTVTYVHPATNATLAITPAPNASGIAHITLVVSDDGGTADGGIAAVTNRFSVTVRSVNDAPTISAIAAQTINEDTSTAPIVFSVADVETPANRLIVRAAASNTNLVASIALGGAGTNRTVTVSPHPDAFGAALIALTVSDPDGGSATTEFALTVRPVNDPPTLSPIADPAPILEDAAQQSVRLVGITAGPSNEVQRLTLTATSSNPQLIPDPNVAFASPDSSAVLSYTPLAHASGTATVTVTLKDDGGTADGGRDTTTRAFMVRVTPVNDAPVLETIADRAVIEGTEVRFAAVASDLERDTLTFALESGAPPGASIQANTGEFAWTPAEAQGPGDYTIGIRVSDNGSPSQQTTRTFRVMVLETNSPPAIRAAPLHTVREGELLRFAASAIDPDVPANILTFALAPGAPSGAAIHPSTGEFTWTPTSAQGPSTNVLTIRVTDNGIPAQSASTNVTIIVTEANSPPVFAAIPAQSVREGELLRFVASATDPDVPANTLTYSLAPGAPSGATLNPDTGEFTWTPNEAQGPSTNTVTIRVSDNGTPSLSATTSVTVVVAEVNRSPALAPLGDQTIRPGDTLSLRATATDPDQPANALRFSLDPGAPAGAVIDPNTGALMWTAAATQAASTNRFTVRVTDNGSPPLSDAKTFSVIVQQSSIPPEVTITSPADQSLFPGFANIDIRVTATDRDGTIAQVVFYAGTQVLGTDTTAPFAFTWSKVPVGDYVLTAVATDNQGLTNRSAPVRIEVSNESALAAIIRTRADSETDLLKEYLSEMGLAARVFDPQNLTFELLRSHKVIVWHDLAGLGPSDNDLALLRTAYQNGAALYFIGEQLASANARLTTATQKQQWSDLIHLKASGASAVPGTIILATVEEFHPILKGAFGPVSDFRYTNRVEAAAFSGGDAWVFGNAGASDALIAAPADVYAEGVKTFTQNFRVSGGDAMSVEERKKLFQNVVCWMLHCRTCTAFSLRLEITGPEHSVRAGATLTFTNLVQHSGECEVHGVVLTNYLARQERFVDAQAVQGVWEYNPAAHAVVFRIGRMTSALAVQTSFTVTPTSGGAITNTATVRASGIRDPVSSRITTAVEGDNLLSVVHGTGGRYLLQVSGEPARTYRLQVSADLVAWRDFTNIAGGKFSLLLPVNTNAHSFYRVVTP